MLWTGTNFFKEIQCGQGICINFTFDFYRGLGSYFCFCPSLSLCLPSFTPLLVLLIASHFHGEGLPPHREFRGSF